MFSIIALWKHVSLFSESYGCWKYLFNDSADTKRFLFGGIDVENISFQRWRRLETDVFSVILVTKTFHFSLIFGGPFSTRNRLDFRPLFGTPLCHENGCFSYQFGHRKWPKTEKGPRGHLFVIFKYPLWYHNGGAATLDKRGLQKKRSILSEALWRRFLQTTRVPIAVSQHLHISLEMLVNLPVDKRSVFRPHRESYGDDNRSITILVDSVGTTAWYIFYKLLLCTLRCPPTGRLIAARIVMLSSFVYWESSQSLVHYPAFLDSDSCWSPLRQGDWLRDCTSSSLGNTRATWSHLQELGSA